jgi:hypothetical protein
VIVLLFSGVCIGLPAGFISRFVRRWSLPRWIPGAPILAALILVAALRTHDAAATSDETSKIPGFLLRIRDAEHSYAAGRPDHAYTCNGPDLAPITGIKWQTEYQLSGTDRNQGQHGRFWILLRCSAEGFQATASALWEGGPRFTFDSRTGIITPDVPLR